MNVHRAHLANIPKAYMRMFAQECSQSTFGIYSLGIYERRYAQECTQSTFGKYPLGIYEKICT